ncbi:MAG: bis(5'-nucleosyl)-tetraphosphatase (symmetrical) YqeK [Lachnospiraceae bacterium]|jgi:predicted HD superfamily hydrolase involved in NAD metabolism|nr:bis(5'-nucleosyl)-tetraphosphatase (symmetrical) YqeK [Lachnospiraceae bacterium]
MKESDVFKIRRSIEKSLDTKRYEHTLGVTYTAAALAMCHGADIRKAQIIGLLHDCGKCVENQKKIAICEKHHVDINEIERRNPSLLHAKVGSFIAMDKYSIVDDEIIQAILNHTTGRPAMTTLEKIVYIADYIEPGRRQKPNLEAIRREAFVDLDKALTMIVADVLSYLDSHGSEIDPMTKETYEYYRQTENGD